MAEPPGPGPRALPDVNVLVALTNLAHQHHREAHRWLEGAPAFATTPVTEIGLLRLLLNRSVTGQEVTPRQALGVLAGVRAHERAVFLPDDTSLSEAGLDLVGLSGHRQVTDAHLVNLARTHGCQMVTFDRRITSSLAPDDRHWVTVL